MRNELKNAVFVDVRNTWEYKNRHLENSILIPFNRLQANLERTIKDKNVPMVVFCSTGTRSKVAAEYMRKRGYAHILGTCTLEEAERLQKR